MIEKQQGLKFPMFIQSVAKLIYKSSIANVFFQGGRGNWAVYYSSPQSFKLKFLFVGLTNLGTFL